MAIPIDPKTNADNGIQPGEANTMPTMAVNTMSRLTLGLVSSKYSRQRQRGMAGVASGGLSGRVDTR